MLLDPPEASRGKRGRSCAYSADRLPVSVGPHYGPRRMAAVVGSLKVISSNRKCVQRVATTSQGQPPRKPGTALAVGAVKVVHPGESGQAVGCDTHRQYRRIAGGNIHTN